MSGWEIRPGDTVWLVATTRTAPRVCYLGVSGVVTEVDGLFLSVDVPTRGIYRVHRANTRRSDPRGVERRTPTRKIADRPASDGFTEVTLW